jgi:nuclease S1
LLGNNHLYSIAAWADDVRRERPDTKGWHYVDIPLGGKYDARRDCALPESCVVQKINDLAKVLTDKNASREQRAEALKFIVHFVGDIHQPLHAVGEAKGGNGVHVRFLDDDRCGRYECNLHGVWDTSMITHTGLNRQD